MQNMKEISESLFFKNQYLRTVDLRNNLIKYLPEAICELSLLWKLRVDYNLLEGLPENVGKLQKLEILTASNNKLKSINHSIFLLGDRL
jgi:Leucine-rich repeat (LRR) protein